MASFKLVLPFLVSCTCSGTQASESCPGGAESCPRGAHEEDTSLLQMFRAGLVQTKQSPVLPNDDCPAKIVGKDWVENWVFIAVDDDSWANERDCYNLTRKDYKTGLAEFSTLFTGVQSCLDAHSELLVEMAFHNIVPPDDTPLPEGCHEGLAQPLVMTSGKPCDKPGELPGIQNKDCVDALSKSGLLVLSLIFGVLGLQLPGNTAILAESVDFLSTALEIIKEIIGKDPSSVLGAIKGVWDIFMAANHENLISFGMWEIFNLLSWWKKWILGIRTLATVALWKLSGGIGVWVTIFQIALVGSTVYDLRESWNGVVEECFGNATTTVAPLLLDYPMNKSDE